MRKTSVESSTEVFLGGEAERLFAKAKRTSASLMLASRQRLLPRLRTLFTTSREAGSNLDS